MRGLLIAFEGLDRTGKSTQTRLLQKYLEAKGEQCQIMKFPDRTTTFGQQIDSFLKQKKKFDDKMLHLIFSINRWELKDQIVDNLNKNVHLILDRYSYSGIAYSNAKGIDYDWCLSPEKGLPKPDLVIYLKANNICDLEKREGYGDEVYEKVEFQARVKKIYESQLIDKNWHTVNACQEIEKVEKEIQEIVERYMSEKQNFDIKYIKQLILNRIYM